MLVYCQFLRIAARDNRQYKKLGSRTTSPKIQNNFSGEKVGPHRTGCEEAASRSHLPYDDTSDEKRAAGLHLQQIRLTPQDSDASATTRHELVTRLYEYASIHQSLPISTHLTKRWYSKIAHYMSCR